MSAQQMQIMGIVLIAAGLVFFALSQFLLIRLREKTMREL